MSLVEYDKKGRAVDNVLAAGRKKSDAVFLARRHNRLWSGKSYAFVRLNPYTTAEYGRRVYDVLLRYRKDL